MPDTSASAVPLATVKQEYVPEINLLADVQRSISTGDWYIGGTMVPQECGTGDSRHTDAGKHEWDLMVGLDTWDGPDVSQVAPKVAAVLKEHGFTVRTWGVGDGDITVQGDRKDGANLTVSLWPSMGPKGGRPITIGYTTRCYPGAGYPIAMAIPDAVIKSMPQYGPPGTYVWPDEGQGTSPEAQP